MRLFRYQNFIKESKPSGRISNFIDSICRIYRIKNYTINENGTVDVDGDVNLYVDGIGLTDLPLKFGRVGGDFYCNGQHHINKLTSLSGSPREVGGDFTCSGNQLKSLSGAPLSVGKDFYCSYNKLTSLEGSPREVRGNFYCRENKQLTSLSGISKYISGRINCENSQLRDVKGIKDGWRGEFHVEGNPVHQIFKLFPKERWDEVIEYLNEYEVIRDGKVVVLQALELVFHEMGLEAPEIDQIEGYDIQF